MVDSNRHQERLFNRRDKEGKNYSSSRGFSLKERYCQRFIVLFRQNKHWILARNSKPNNVILYKQTIIKYYKSPGRTKHVLHPRTAIMFFVGPDGEKQQGP